MAPLAHAASQALCEVACPRDRPGPMQRRAPGLAPRSGASRYWRARAPSTLALLASLPPLASLLFNSPDLEVKSMRRRPGASIWIVGTSIRSQQTSIHPQQTSIHQAESTRQGKSGKGRGGAHPCHWNMPARTALARGCSCISAHLAPTHHRRLTSGRGAHPSCSLLLHGQQISQAR